MKVTVDEALGGAGHGMCLTLCPEVFEMTDDGWGTSRPIRGVKMSRPASRMPPATPS